MRASVCRLLPSIGNSLDEGYRKKADITTRPTSTVAAALNERLVSASMPLALR